MLLTTPERLEEPRQISSLVAWWDFSDESLMSFSGTNISSLADKCATGANLQFESGLVGRPYHAQPVNSINGRPSAGFAGDQEQTMRTTADNSALRFGSGPFTIVTVFTCTDTTDRAVLVHRGDSTGLYSFRINDTNANDHKAKIAIKNTDLSVYGVVSDDEIFNDGNVYILTGMRDDSDNLALYTNNVEVDESPTASASGDINPPGTHYVWVGSAEGLSGINGQWFKGQIGEVLVFDDELSSDEREYLHRYLRKKWSI